MGSEKGNNTQASDSVKFSARVTQGPTLEELKKWSVIQEIELVSRESI